jgi:two-component system, sporulation sensor kinase B
MLFIFISLWIMAAILIWTDPQDERTRWASLMAFVGGSAGLSVFVGETLVPFLIERGWEHTALLNWLLIIRAVASFLCLAGLPYAFIMFALATSRRFPARFRQWMSLILLLPVLHPLYVSVMNAEQGYSFLLFMYWAVPYTVAGSVLLIDDYVREKNPLVRKTKLYTNVLVITPIVAYALTNYVLRSFQIEDVWRYNTVIIVVVFVAFIVLGAKNGVLGVKMSFEKQRDLDQKMQTLHSGTSILHHTIKNEVGKMKILADRIQYVSAKQKEKDLASDAQKIMLSADHMLAMVGRIQDLLSDFDVREETFRLTDMIAETVARMQPELERQQVSVRRHYHKDVFLKADPVHLQEVLSNIMHNAIEASQAGRSISIDVNVLKKDVVIAIQDEGIGIPNENLKLIFDPFFTTKNTSLNFGLGLSYCHKVLQKHDGSIQIHSELHQGTTVYLHLPQKRMVSEVNGHSSHMLERKDHSGKDQTVVG